MSCTGITNCTCGCCAGTSVQTPQSEVNPPGQSALTYRAGTWATFKESMLARLSSSDYPALTSLKTRDDDDFTIAFLDATATVLDILTFYQERLANESYLRTAGQVRSLTELSRLIGFQPSPGVSAATYLAFTLKSAPALSADPSASAITIPRGTQSQSVPAQGQKPQTFETSADIPAKADWNALPVQTGIPWLPATGDVSAYLNGTATQLQPGDLILIVGDERAHTPGNNNWDLRVVSKVVADGQNSRTYIEWSEGLGSATVTPTQKHPKVYAFRQRAALFGYNAVNPRMLDTTNTKIGPLLAGGVDWRNFHLTGSIDLDAVYSKVVKDSWVAMIHPDNNTARTPEGFVSLYRVSSLAAVARSDFGLSAKITRVFPDLTSNLTSFPLRTTIVLAQSDELTVAEQPLTYPLYGTYLDLEEVRPDLLSAQVSALFGKRQKLRVKSSAPKLWFAPDDGSESMLLNPDDVVTVSNPLPLPLQADGSIPDWSNAASVLVLSVVDAHGRPGVLNAALNCFTLEPSSKADPDVSECALVSSVANVTAPFPHTRIQLKYRLGNCYDRFATTVNVNVSQATNGQSVAEVMGSGSASTPNQRFTLRQSPLTYVQAPTPTGRSSTLTVKANGMNWQEVPTLYQQAASATVFSTQAESDGTTDVLFGDGVEGSTLPTGQNNLQANYRIGSGSGANVGARTITTLLDRPLGVSGVTNPQPATGGQDPQSVTDIRTNAPQTVLTLGRAVSVTDYQNFAATFAGIAKAHAIWLPSGPGRGVFLTVAGVGGVALSPGNLTLNNLVSSLQDFGNPLTPIRAQTFIETLFGLAADVAYDSGYDQPSVKATITQRLYQAYGFQQRAFGQGVSVDEVAALIQAVPGVVAVNVTGLHTVASSAAGDLAASAGAITQAVYNAWLSGQVTLPRQYNTPVSRICAYLPVASPTSTPLAAEILVLDPDPKQVVLGVMS